MNTKRILITGSRAPATLFLIRKLGLAGHKIFTTECVDFNIGKYSKYVYKNYIVEPPNKNFSKFTEDIKNIVVEEKIDLIIPTCEEIFYISKAKSELEKFCKVFCDTNEKLIELHNKWSFYEKISNSNIYIKLPKSYLINSKEQILKIFEKEPIKKYILKPIYSRFALKVHILENKKDIINLNLENCEYILQEFIEGEQYCSYSIIKDRGLSLHSDYKTEFSANPSKMGATIAFKHANNTKIKEFCESFSKEFNLFGQFAFDFIESNNEIYIIECNPRLTSGIQLFEDEKLLSDIFLEIQREKTVYPSPNTKSNLAFAMLIYGILNFNSFQSFKYWLKTLLSSNDVLFDKRDIKPFLMQGIILFTMLFSTFKKKIDLKEISTYGIEWNGD